MKKNGFTLIELLAVIIILAIIALIATPIVLNVIDDAKKSAAESEANLVLSGVNNYCATEAMKIQMGSLTAADAKCGEDFTASTVADMINYGKNTTVDEAELTGGVLSTLEVTSNGYTYELSSGKMVEKAAN